MLLRDLYLGGLPPAGATQEDTPNGIAVASLLQQSLLQHVNVNTVAAACQRQYGSAGFVYIPQDWQVEGTAVHYCRCNMFVFICVHVLGSRRCCTRSGQGRVCCRSYNSTASCTWQHFPLTRTPSCWHSLCGRVCVAQTPNLHPLCL
ncbi:unnamed protein product, partial [Ectocarpus fasciculatus]